MSNGKIMGLPGSAAPISGVIGSIEFEIRNTRGTLLLTTPDLIIAKKWLSERSKQWPGDPGR